MDHEVVLTEAGYACRVCGWQWKRRPRSACPKVRRFGYREAPQGYLTYTELRKQGLQPRDRRVPDGCYYRTGRKQWLWFYDRRQAVPRRPGSK